MQPMLNTALEVARSTADMIYKAYERVDTLDVEAKGTNDFVTKVDKTSEAMIIEGLRKRYPRHSFLGEEFGLQEGEDKDYVWVIDPLDGTTNFIHGIPQFAISIGLKVKGQMEVAVVINPVSKEEFTASRGRGAQMNGRRIRVSKKTKLEGALLSTGFPFRPDQNRIFDAYMGMFGDFAKATAGIRRAGAVAKPVPQGREGIAAQILDRGGGGILQPDPEPKHDILHHVLGRGPVAQQVDRQAQKVGQERL